MIDTDELLLPAGNQTLTQVLKQAQKDKTFSQTIAGISFRNVYYGADASEALPAKGHFIIGNSERAGKPFTGGRFIL